jgi:hypothetical protein
MKRNRVLAILSLAILIPGSIVAQADLNFSFAPSDFWAAEFQLGLSGLDVLPGLDSMVFVGGEVAYNGIPYYRRADGSYYLPQDGDFSEDAVSVTRFRGNWNAGFQQGILPPSTGRTGSAAGRPCSTRATISRLPAISPAHTWMPPGCRRADGFVNHAFLARLSFDDAAFDSHYVASGLDARIELEYAPAGINSYSDYFHASFWVRSYLPIFDQTPDEPKNRLSLYLANFAGVRYLDGSAIPVEESYSNGLVFRGIETQRFATSLLASVSTELRLGLPAIILPQIVPGVLLFTDAGYYFDNADYQGFLLSHGAAVYLNILGYVQIGGRISVLSSGQKMDGAVLTPIELMVFYQF